MTELLIAGLIFLGAALAFILIKWGNVDCVGSHPVSTFTFLAILFTSGLDVGLIMFPLTEFAGYQDIITNPEYAFTNALAIEFGFWAFFIWSFYFLTCFYFAVLEPKVKFFEITWVKVINNIVIIGTCAFTGYLLLSNLSWYAPELAASENGNVMLLALVLIVISLAVFSSTELRYVRTLSVSSTLLFFALILFMLFSAVFKHDIAISEYASTLGLLSGYFTNINEFMMPLNDYHEFYLYWWFSWAIMIGQFTAKFVNGMKTYKLFAAMLICPSIIIGLWFGVLYLYHQNQIPTSGFYNYAMLTVGIVFVINSLDSLIRLYTDNLNITKDKLGFSKYIALNLSLMVGLTLLFKLELLKIEWFGALVIGLFYAAVVYMVMFKRAEIASITDKVKLNYAQSKFS